MLSQLRVFRSPAVYRRYGAMNTQGPFRTALLVVLHASCKTEMENWQAITSLSLRVLLLRPAKKPVAGLPAIAAAGRQASQNQDKVTAKELAPRKITAHTKKRKCNRTGQLRAEQAAPHLLTP